MEKQFTECSRCNKPIYYGNAYVTILRNVEQADYELATDSEEVTVIDSQEIITFCGSCGNSFNADIIGNIINGLPTDNSKLINN